MKHNVWWAVLLIRHYASPSHRFLYCFCSLFPAHGNGLGSRLLLLGVTAKWCKGYPHTLWEEVHPSVGKTSRPNQSSASCKNYKIHLHTFFSRVIQNPLNHQAPTCLPCVPFLVLISQNAHSKGIQFIAKVDSFMWPTPGKSYSTNKIHIYGCGSISPQASYNLTCNSYL